MTTIIVNNNGPTSAKPSPNTPGPKSIRNQSLKQTIRDIAKTFLSHYDEGTADEFFKSQKYTDAELILFCKAAKIPYSGKNKEEKLKSICAFLNKNRRSVIDYIEIVGNSGELIVSGIVVGVALFAMMVQQFNKLKAIKTGGAVSLDSSNGPMHIFYVLLSMIFITCLCSFCAKNNTEQKEYKTSVKDLKRTWTNLKKTHKHSKRKRTTSVRRLAHTTKQVHVARTRAKLSKAKKKLYSCNSVLSKIKRRLFGGPTQVDLQQDIDRLIKTLEVNQLT